MYLAAGVFASVVSLFAFPLEVSVGASGAISVSTVCYRGDCMGTDPAFALDDSAGDLETSGAAAGVSCSTRSRPAAENGAELGRWSGARVRHRLARGMSERKPPARRIAVAVAVSLGIRGGPALPLRRNVRRAAGDRGGHRLRRAHGVSRYQAAVKQFKLGAINARRWPRIIERTIVRTCSRSSRA